MYFWRGPVLPHLQFLAYQHYINNINHCAIEFVTKVQNWTFIRLRRNHDTFYCWIVLQENDTLKRSGMTVGISFHKLAPASTGNQCPILHRIILFTRQVQIQKSIVLKRTLSSFTKQFSYTVIPQLLLVIYSHNSHDNRCKAFWNPFTLYSSTLTFYRAVKSRCAEKRGSMFGVGKFEALRKTLLKVT